MIRITDSYSPISMPVARTIKHAGYSGCARYLGAKTLRLPNGMTREEVSALRVQGLEIVSIWETTPTYASYFTPSQARQDAQYALKEADWLHQRAGSTIYFTVDYDAQEADFSAIIDYFSILRSVLGARYKLGAYGGIRTLRALQGSSGAPDAYWQTIAWSGGERFNGVSLYQAEVSQRVNGFAVDINEVLVADPGWWNGVVTMKATTKVEPKPAESPEVTAYDRGYTAGIAAAIKQLEEMHK